MEKNKHKAPDAKVMFSDGLQKHLRDLWQRQTLVLVFLRHFGWPFCREQVAQLRRKKKSFEKAGAQVVLVGMGTPSESAEFAVNFNIPFPIVADPEKKLYRKFGLKQMSSLALLSPGVVLKGVAAMVGGHGIGMPQGDVRQLPGVFIINTAGQVVFSHFASNPADHPDAETIIAALN